MPNEIIHFPARIIRAAGDLFPGDEVLLSRYRERYPDSAAVPFFLRVEISNNGLDWYYTHMMTSSLNNYAADADAGVAFQDSHRSGNLGYGRSLFGEYRAEAGTPPGWDRMGRSGSSALPAIERPSQYERVLSVAYIIPGLALNQASYGSTDDFIRAVQAGAVDQVSIGYGAGRETCDVCGARYWSWDCPHIAGMTYDIERGNDQAEYLATVSIHDARLLEYSAVYAGATPNALVLRKAEQEAESGRLSDKAADLIEQRYRVRLRQRNWISDFGFRNAEDLNRPQEVNTVDQLEQVRALLAEAGIEAETAVEQAREVVAELSRLRPLADQGRQYRADLITEALAEGVRANGEKFPQETYRGILERADIDAIKTMRDDWARLASQRFPGGRQTVDGEEQSKPQQQRKSRVPASAYAA